MKKQSLTKRLKQGLVAGGLAACVGCAGGLTPQGDAFVNTLGYGLTNSAVANAGEKAVWGDNRGYPANNSGQYISNIPRPRYFNKVEVFVDGNNDNYFSKDESFKKPIITGIRPDIMIGFVVDNRLVNNNLDLHFLDPQGYEVPIKRRLAPINNENSSIFNEEYGLDNGLGTYRWMLTYGPHVLKNGQVHVR
jgi:hypothetical protein